METRDMKVYLATWMLESSQGKALTKVGKRERLLSYFHTIQVKDQLKRYVKTGKNRKKKK